MKKIVEELIQEKVSLDKTLTFIKKAHAGQKYGSDPYWKHPKAVSETGKRFFGSKFNVDAQNAALLHDVPEDTPYTADDLKRMGYSDKVINAVKLLTKDRSLSYTDNIRKIISSGDKIAMMVKFADNYVNYTGDKSGWDATKREKSQKKYRDSLYNIGSKLGIKKGLPESSETNLAKRYEKSMLALAEVLDIEIEFL